MCAPIQLVVTSHCGLVTLYDNMINLHHWYRWRLDAWRHQAITWTNVDLKVARGIHLRTISHEMLIHLIVAGFQRYILNTGLWCICCRPEQSVQQTVALSVMWDTRTLMWHWCDVLKFIDDSFTKSLLISMDDNLLDVAAWKQITSRTLQDEFFVTSFEFF